MKKLLALSLACLTANVQCMEQPELTDIPSELGSFSNLPDELMVYFFSFMPKGASIKEIFNTLAELSLVDSKCKRIADDAYLLRQLAKRFITLHGQEAEKEFLDAIEHIGKDDSASKHYKIIAALALVWTSPIT